jgi:hypothetical protein
MLTHKSHHLVPYNFITSKFASSNLISCDNSVDQISNIVSVNCHVFCHSFRQKDSFIVDQKFEGSVLGLASIILHGAS